jgi:hypothetical protein
LTGISFTNCYVSSLPLEKWRGITRKAYALLSHFNTSSKRNQRRDPSKSPNLATTPIVASIYLLRVQCTHSHLYSPFKRALIHTPNPSIANLPPTIAHSSNGPQFNPISNTHPSKLQPKYPPFGINALPRSGDPKRKTT